MGWVGGGEIFFKTPHDKKCSGPPNKSTRPRRAIFTTLHHLEKQLKFLHCLTPDIFFKDEETFSCPFHSPVVHGAGEHLHGDWVDAEEVADEDDAVQPLVPGAQAGQGADVVGDGHQGGPGQVLRAGQLGIQGL